ncbi:MAG: hypothetical protein SX243_18580 [Acidobacteriota bacterium]|nr:hypothetical protein [Acidobacteriota bacterium]
MIGSALSVLSSVAGLHSWVSGIRQGEAQESILDELRTANIAIEKLSERIFYAESLKEVRATDSEVRLRAMERKSDVYALLEPLQRSLGEDLLSTAMLSTTEKLQAAFREDPWEVLFSIRPLVRAKAPSNPDALPIIFSDTDSYYVGWQMKGTLPSLFGCEYDEAKGLFKGTGEVVVPSLSSIGSPSTRTEEKSRARHPKKPPRRSKGDQDNSGPAATAGPVPTAPRESPPLFEHEAVCDTAFGRRSGFLVKLTEGGISFKGNSTGKYDFDLSWHVLVDSEITVTAADALMIESDKGGQYTIVLTKEVAQELAGAMASRTKPRNLRR